MHFNTHVFLSDPKYFILCILKLYSQVVLVIKKKKKLACQSKRCKRCLFDPWVGKIPEGGHGSPLQYSCLENPMDRGAWRLPSMESKRIRRDWSNIAHRHTFSKKTHHYPQISEGLVKHKR